jgi:CubicO group peptidase (beta-lactamase class C family)
MIKKILQWIGVVLKKILKWLGIGFSIIIIGGFIPATLGAYGLFWERYTTSLLGNPLDPRLSWYTPLEKTTGNFSQPLATLVNEGSTIQQDVFQEASDYAELHGSDSLVIQHNGKIVYENYWNDTKPESLFALHSITKTMNALLIGHAIEEGFIDSVDIPVATFIEEWKGSSKENIQIRDLLNMASGIQESYNFNPTSSRIQRIMGLDIVAPNIAAETKGKPGTAFSHANPNSQILGIIIERATGQRFSEYFSEKIWQPLGARDAFFFVDRPGGMVHTDCCMWASIRDLVRVGEMLLGKGVFKGSQIIPAGWVDEMIQPSKANVNYGMQLWLGNEFVEYRPYDPSTTTFANYHSEPFQVDDVFYLDGLGKKRLYIVPSKSLVILRTGPNSSEWDDSKLPNLLIGALN